MIKTIKKLLIMALAAIGILFVIYMYMNTSYVIKDSSFAYFICAFAIAGGTLLILHIIEKRFRNKKISTIIISVLLAVITLIFCCSALGIKRFLHGKESFYDINSDYISEELVLYEYDSVMSVRGCLCVRVNDFIYRIIPDTNYTTDPDICLADPDNMILDFNPDTKTLTMKYRTREGGDYIENTAVLK